MPRPMRRGRPCTSAPQPPCATAPAAACRRAAAAVSRRTAAAIAACSLASVAMATSSQTRTITVYSKPDCHLCAEAMLTLRRLQQELGFALRELDIAEDEALHRAYFERIPVIALDGEELCEYHVSEALVRERLESRR